MESAQENDMTHPVHDLPFAKWVTDLLKAQTAEIKAQTEEIVTRLADRAGTRPANGPATREYLTTEEAAEYLGCSRQKLEIDRVKGTGPAFCKPNRNMVRYRRADLDTYMLQARRRTTESDGGGRSG